MAAAIISLIKRQPLQRTLLAVVILFLLGVFNVVYWPEAIATIHAGSRPHLVRHHALHHQQHHEKKAAAVRATGNEDSRPGITHGAGDGKPLPARGHIDAASMPEPQQLTGHDQVSKGKGKGTGTGKDGRGHGRVHDDRGVADPAGAEMVRNMMRRSFIAYRKNAWGHDELRPDKVGGIDGVGFVKGPGMGLSIIEMLGTLHIMGLKDEEEEALIWVKDEFHFGRAKQHHVFEVNIRILGGLLSAYELIGDRMLLEKATEVGEVLLGAFKPGNVLPCGIVDLTKPNSCTFEYGVHSPFTSGVGTLALEWLTLSRHTGMSKWADHISEINNIFLKQPILLQDQMNIKTGAPKGKVHVGGGVDSAYEYFLKQWLLDSSLAIPHRLWADSINAIKKHLLGKVGRYTLFIEEGASSNKWTHLQCFLGALLMQGGEVDLGLQITETCVAMYAATPSGLACDEVGLVASGKFRCLKNEWLNRPETVESLFVAWRITHDTKWRKAGMRILNAIERNCRKPGPSLDSGGYYGLRNPASVASGGKFKIYDRQHSWFLARQSQILT